MNGKKKELRRGFKIDTNKSKMNFWQRVIKEIS